MVMSAETLTTAPAGRVKLGNIHVMIDGKPHEIVNMNIVDVLVAGAPDWIAPRQKIDFSFVITIDDHPRPLPTYGVVVRNDGKGLEIRYNAPALRWRDILAHLIAEDAKHATTKAAAGKAR